jgi:hypothetical protein
MSNGFVNIRGERFPLDQVLFVEPNDPSKNAGNIPNPERFNGRVVFTDGTSKLIEQTPDRFAKDHGFRLLGGPDGVGVNPAIKISIQPFDAEAARSKNPDFQPERAFASRLSWSAGSKLLQADPETAATALLGKNALTIRGERFSLDHVLLVEANDPSKNAGTIPNPERFAGRVLFIDGTSKLIEQSPAQFSDEHNFRHLGGPDNVAVNPAIRFSVREFDLKAAQEKNPGFGPERSFASRLSWPGGSRLLLADADTAATALLTSATRGAARKNGPQAQEPRNE